MKIKSSNQWFTLLDSFIYSAIECLINNTRFVEFYIGSLINYQFLHKRRRLSISNNYSDSIKLMGTFLTYPNVSNFRNINFDRGYSIFIIHEFIKLTKSYQLLALKDVSNPKIRYIQNSVGAKIELFNTINHLKCCYSSIV
jgi:hypothetical protein